MVERITDDIPAPSLRHGTNRIPDGRLVRQPPRPAQHGMSRSEQVGWALAAGIVLVLLVAGIAGTLR